MHYNAAVSGIHADIARMMGHPISSDAIQLRSPNHPVELMNWDSITLMLTEQLATNQGVFRKCVVIGQPPREVTGIIVLDANSNSGKLPISTE